MGGRKIWQGSTNRQNTGLLFGREGLCWHATGLNYAVPRLPALIAAPLFLFIIFSQPILLFSPYHISNKFSIDIESFFLRKSLFYLWT